MTKTSRQLIRGTRQLTKTSRQFDEICYWESLIIQHLPKLTAWACPALFDCNYSVDWSFDGRQPLAERFLLIRR
jgi:hypothetical protein